jgi:hypothetical protein
MQAAFYKGTKPGLAALFDIGVHEWEEGHYAHAVLIFSDGRSASSTYLGDGVAISPAGAIDFDAADWDFIDLTGFDEAAALQWFEAHVGAKYDTLGDAHFVVGFIKHSKGKYFCSEAVGEALGFRQAWRFDPNGLYCALSRVREIYDQKAQ